MNMAATAPPPVSLNRRKGTSRNERLDVSKFLRNATVVVVVLMVSFIAYISSHAEQQNNKNNNKSSSSPIHPTANLVQHVVSMDDDYYTTKQIAEYSNIEDQLSNPDNEQQQQINIPFVRANCDLTDVEWYPTGDVHWQQRAPYFFILGAKKAGTTTLWTWFNQHPWVLRADHKELKRFLPAQFNDTSVDGKIMVKAVRAKMYDTDHGDFYGPALYNDDKLLSFDATPGYLFMTSTAIRGILCTAPWAKLLVTLREPVDRVKSHYNFMMDPTKDRSVTAIFEDWLEDDLAVLRQAGVIQNEIPNEEFYGSNAEKVAWNRYLDLSIQHNTNVAGPIGRSMYIIQLEIWYEALKEVGRDPDTELMVIRNMDMRNNPDETYNKILWWLEMPSHTLKNHNEAMKSTYVLPEMKNETRTLLCDFFKPYNQRLYNLLGEDWTEDWDSGVVRKVPPEQIFNVATAVNANESANEEEEAAVQKQVLPVETETVQTATTKADEVKLIPNYEIPVYNVTQGKIFTDQWCDLTNAVWYPTLASQTWRLRAPYFMLPGAKKSGTTSLASYIMQHPLVERARTKELQFFMNRNFRLEYVDENRKTLVRKARQKMYEMEYHSSVLMADKSKISFDATPGYLFFSAMLPQRILCVTPWIKLLLILRNPVDRAYSNHAYVTRMTGMKIEFEKWLEHDLEALKTAGILDATTEEEEDARWPEYLKLAGEGPIGRGLYDIQIRQWTKALADAGRDPTTQIHIVRSEDMHVNKDGEYRKVLHFLGLPYVPMKNEDEKVVSDYQHPMKNETRNMLEALFEPYNKKLYKRLGGDWEGFWDPKKE